MSKDEIDNIFKIIKIKKEQREKNKQIPKRVKFIFNNLNEGVPEEIYQEIEKEIYKLKEKYSKIENTIKEEIQKRINDITFNEFMEYINELKNISTIDGFYKINNKNNKNINFEDYIKLNLKIKHIILLKGILTCYTILSQEIIYYIWFFEYFIEKYKENIIETKNLTEFILKSIFLIGNDEKYENIQKKIGDKYSKDNFYSFNSFLDKIFFGLKNEPTRKPNSYIEKILSEIMRIKNMEDKSEISLIDINGLNIDSFDEFEKNFFKEILIPDVKKLNNEILIDKKIKKDFDLNRSEINIKPENRLFFYLKENLGKDEDLKTEYKIINSFDELTNNYDKKFKFKKTICSFLNTKGGRIFIGINDNFEVVGYDISSEEEKNFIENKIDELISDFYPEVEKDKIKIHFVPIKDYDSKMFYKYLYVIKIIVSQGNIHELYSIRKDSYHSFVRLPGIVRELTRKDIKEEIIRRKSTKEKPVDPREFDDIEPFKPY